MKPGLYLILCLGITLSYLAIAADDIHVVVLFKDRAMVVIDGKRQMLSLGESSPQGVTLISADSDVAVLEYKGERFERQLDGRTKAPAANVPTKERVQIYPDTDGMFRTVGSINGLPVSFLVDTGASSVAMNSGQARRLGIDFRVQGDSTFVATASQVVQAYSLTLERVKVGTIELRNIRAVVIDGAQPGEVLLGMSFLGRLDIRNQAGHLSLQKKY